MMINSPRGNLNQIIILIKKSWNHVDIIQSSTFLIAAMDVVELDKLIAGKSSFLSSHHHDITKQTQSLRLVGFHIKV